jgi:penicillin-binding protein 1C
MQVARLLAGEHERSGAGKLRQALRALALERKLSKDAILRLYLRLAPFGGNLEGVRAASLAYFGKEPRRLSLAEGALLVALPQSPALRRPDRFPEAALRARNRVLRRRVGRHPRARIPRAMSSAWTVRREFPMLAPHLADAEVEQNKTRLVHHLTIDRSAQASLEQLTRDHGNALGGRLSAALIAVDHRSGEVIAHVGSPGYLDEDRFGAVDMTSAVRSPGSTLKPIIYGLAFEAGLAHPETLIEDRPTRFGVYVPKNFDQDWHGTVTIRMALAQSLNIPAVKVLDALGAQKLFGRLGQVGIAPVLPKGAEPSLAIALGGLGLKLSDLATLYVGLARGGPGRAAVSSRHRRSQSPWRQPRLGCRRWPPGMSPTSCATRRRCQRARQIATRPAPPTAGRLGSGHDGRHTIAVWVDRLTAPQTPGLAGRTAAAPCCPTLRPIGDAARRSPRPGALVRRLPTRHRRSHHCRKDVSTPVPT